MDGLADQEGPAGLSVSLRWLATDGETGTAPLVPVVIADSPWEAPGSAPDTDVTPCARVPCGAPGREPGRRTGNRYPTLAGTIRGWNSNRLGSSGLIVALTQWVCRAPKVSTRVKFASTPPLGRLIGLSILK